MRPRSRDARTGDRRNSTTIEENLKLKRKSSFLMPAAFAAALLPLAAAGQITPASSPTPSEKVERTYNWEVSAGYGYSSLNQVNQSQSGLQGVELSVMRDFGKHFGVIADGAYYKYPLKSGNPGSPAIDAVLFGPVVHAELYGHISGF